MGSGKLWRKAMNGYSKFKAKSAGYSLVLALILGHAIFAVGQQKVTSGVPAKNKVYVIQPNDTLEIFVWKEPDLTRKVMVRPDGMISFPLVQDLLAAGVSPGELKNRIELKLKEYLTSPNVTVIVDNI